MDITKILAAKLDLNLDYDQITQEILDCKQYFIYTPPYDEHLKSAQQGDIFMVESQENYDHIDYIEKSTGIVQKRNLAGPEIFYLTRYKYENPLDRNRNKYSVTKELDHNDWLWRTEIKDRLSYTIQSIENLPFFSKVGCVRAFIMKDTFLPTHRDYGWKMSNEQIDQRIDRCLGLSLIPSTGNVDMKIWSDKDQQVLSIPGNAMLFNDSQWHGVPLTSGYRITLRIFGQVNYSRFLPYLDKNFTFYF